MVFHWVDHENPLKPPSGGFYFVLKTAFIEFNFQHKDNESSAGVLTIAEVCTYPKSRKL